MLKDAESREGFKKRPLDLLTRRLLIILFDCFFFTMLKFFNMYIIF